MKITPKTKYVRILLSVVVLCLCACLFSACKKDEKPVYYPLVELDAPELEYDNYTLSWQPDEGCQNYLFEILGKKYQIDKTEVDVLEYVNRTGAFVAKVTALGDKIDYKDSPTSVLEFEVTPSENLIYSKQGFDKFLTAHPASQNISGKIVVPSTYNGMPVGKVDNFSGTNITEIFFHDEVWIRKSGTFENCKKLKKVIAANSEFYIYANTFKNCTALETVIIKGKLKDLHDEAFYGCSSLSDVSWLNLDDLIQTLSDNKTELGLNLGKHALHNTAWYDRQPDGMVYLKDYIYAYKGDADIIKERDFAPTAATLAPYAFAGTGVQEVSLPSNVTSRQAFNDSSVKKITLAEGTTKTERSSFLGCESLEQIILPNSLTSLASGSFHGCSSLKSISLPDNITEIPSISFKNCSSLISVEWPANLTAIGSSAFENCGFVALALPSTVKQIDNHAFGGCKKLTYFGFPANITEIPYQMFKGCAALTQVDFPQNLTIVGESAFYGCSSLEELSLPDSVSEIGSGAFADCSSLKSFKFPASITEIGNWFYNCNNLTSLTIPGNVIGIQKKAFKYCGAIKSVTFEENSKMEALPAYAFAECETLTDVTLPSNMTSIEDSAFYGCIELTNVTLPGSLSSIGSSAFYGCAALASVELPAGITSIETALFRNCTSLTSVKFNGAMAQWQALTKSEGWDYNTPDFTVYCSDGNLDKNGNQL